MLMARISHGYPFLPILRSSLVRILYESLKRGDTTVTTNAEVVDIETHEEGVRVHLHNGDKVDGSIVIGADGVHSRVRKMMYNQAGQTDENMASSFHGIFGWADITDLPIEREVFFESRGAGAVIQCLGTPDKLQFTTLKPLPETITRRQRYSRQEMEDYATSLAEIKICPGVTFADVWARADKKSAIMLNQEEGFMSHWHHDRIVLVGDAVHKSTSVNGLGMTCGLHSAAVLANLLQGLVANTKQSPSVEELSSIFSLYQQERQAEVKPVWDRGYSMLREVTKGTWLSWLWDKYVLPWIDIEELLQGWIPSLVLIRYGNILSYVPFIGEEGSVRWLRQPVV
jgi:2-polyprenyl-6-methoxyphenol hydroxylase-like FAD-dependent oxidoreductase